MSAALQPKQTSQSGLFFRHTAVKIYLHLARVLSVLPYIYMLMPSGVENCDVHIMCFLSKVILSSLLLPRPLIAHVWYSPPSRAGASVLAGFDRPSPVARAPDVCGHAGDVGGARCQEGVSLRKGDVILILLLQNVQKQI